MNRCTDCAHSDWDIEFKGLRGECPAGYMGCLHVGYQAEPKDVEGDAVEGWMLDQIWGPMGEPVQVFSSCPGHLSDVIQIGGLSHGQA